MQVGCMPSLLHLYFSRMFCYMEATSHCTSTVIRNLHTSIVVILVWSQESGIRALHLLTQLAYSAGLLLVGPVTDGSQNGTSCILPL
jgi:hypothetical protein